MLPRRKIILALSVLLVVGSLSASLGYALYLRSASYRHCVAADVAALLDLPTEIGAVDPLSSHSRQFRDVRVWLPQRESPVFSCARAVWHGAQRDGASSNVLDLDDGRLLLGTGEFSRDDYRRMLQSSLGLDFAQLHLGRVNLHAMDIVWQQPEFALRVEDAAGDVLFDADGMGRASLAARNLNGSNVAEPINIRALFTPGAGMTIHHVALEVPRIPLAALGLGQALDSTITTGWFDGTVTYRRMDDTPVLTLRGSIRQARLDELTTRVRGGPYSGTVDVNVSEAVLARDGLRAIVFSGELSDLHPGELAPLLDAADLAGRLNLRIHQARYRAGSLQHLSASADAADVSMAAVTTLLGRGVITGKLRVTLNALLVVDDTLRWADIDLDVVPPDDAPGTISREVIGYAASKLLDIDLGTVADYLPENVTYARIGCKLLIDRDQLTVKGSHGTGGRTILTVQVFGRQIGLLHAPRRTYSVPDLLEALRTYVAAHRAGQFLDWGKTNKETPAK